MIDRAAAGEVDLFWIVGGNFLETLPDAERSRRALSAAAPSRPSGHRPVLVDARRRRRRRAAAAGDDALRVRGGGTETSTERRIIFSPEIPGRRIGSAKPEWWVFREVMARAVPERPHLFGFDRCRRDSRRDRARDPALSRHREAAAPRAIRFSGAAARCTPTAASPRRTARRTFAAVSAAVPPRRIRPRAATAVRRVSTRRGKQFNSMVQREVDPLTGARRDDILISPDDLERSAPPEGAAVRLRSRAERSAASCERRRSSPAIWRSIGPRATRCCRPRQSIPIRWSPTTTRG